MKNSINEKSLTKADKQVLIGARNERHRRVAAEALAVKKRNSLNKEKRNVARKLMASEHKLANDRTARNVKWKKEVEKPEEQATGLANFIVAFLASFFMAVAGKVTPAKLALLAKKIVSKQTSVYEKNVSFINRVTNHLRTTVVTDSRHGYNLVTGMLMCAMQKKLKLSNQNPDNPQFVILMGMPNTGMIVTATMKLSRDFPNMGIEARAMINACSGNPLIVVLPATITAMLVDMLAFDTAQPNTKKRTVVLAAIRDEAWGKVHNHLKVLMAVAQAAAFASPSTAISTIESGLFHVKNVPDTRAIVFRALEKSNVGTVSLKAPQLPRAVLHVWEKSLDGIVWVRMDKTSKGKFKAIALISVTKVWFRHCADADGEMTEWEIIYAIVK
ncbi:MAG: hypothetical protein WCL14_05135 [Bacteroidota bacterium]